jgi:hypothetical protein
MMQEVDMASSEAARAELENVNHPGTSRLVDAAIYEAMKRALLVVLPRHAPGLTVAELQQRVLAHLPEDLYPDGAKAGWWTKALQLDLEAKGLVGRTKTTPIRLHRLR